MENHSQIKVSLGSGHAGLLSAASLIGRRFFFISAFLLVSYLVLAFLVARAVRLHAIDLDLVMYQRVILLREVYLTDFFLTLTYLGSTFSVGLLGLIAFLFLWVRRERSYAVLLAAAGLGSTIGVRLSKFLVERPRPDSAGWLMTVTNTSFPSGHATESAAILGALFYILGSFSRTRGQRYSFYALGVVLVAAIGFSRIYLGVHYASDVLAGLLLGSSILCFAIALSRYSRFFLGNLKLKNHAAEYGAD